MEYNNEQEYPDFDELYSEIERRKKEEEAKLIEEKLAMEAMEDLEGSEEMEIDEVEIFKGLNFENGKIIFIRKPKRTHLRRNHKYGRNT